MKQLFGIIIYQLYVGVEKKKARGRALKRNFSYTENSYSARVEKKKARGRALKLTFNAMFRAFILCRKEESPR